MMSLGAGAFDGGLMYHTEFESGIESQHVVHTQTILSKREAGKMSFHFAGHQTKYKIMWSFSI